MTRREEIAELLGRLTRLHAARRRSADLPEAQVAAIDYLARANRFSRTPSAAADYLAATRGTVSQTLLALARKGLVADEPAPDRRSRIYSLTASGRKAAACIPAPASGPDEELVILAGLRAALHALIRSGGGRTFGLCRTCRHHRTGPDGAFCALLKISLTDVEADQICHEHQAA